MSVILTMDQYTALASIARRSASGPSVEAFLADIEKTNGIMHYFLKMRWQELDSPLPKGTDFPKVWPPELEADLESSTRAISLVDVDAILKDKAKKPENVMVTRDPAGLVGWIKIVDFFK